MYDPIVKGFKWVLGLVLPPSLISLKPRLTYISVHYLYLICMSLGVSVILYGGGLMPYIDALFFAAGSSTQSGLNTINVNRTELYAQITMFLVANVCNPIFINTMVVVLSK